jgi:hypothetical protein
MLTRRHTEISLLRQLQGEFADTGGQMATDTLPGHRWVQALELSSCPKDIRLGQKQ